MASTRTSWDILPKELQLMVLRYSFEETRLIYSPTLGSTDRHDGQVLNFRLVSRWFFGVAELDDVIASREVIALRSISSLLVLEERNVFYKPVGLFRRLRRIEIVSGRQIKDSRDLTLRKLEVMLPRLTHVHIDMTTNDLAHEEVQEVFVHSSFLPNLKAVAPAAGGSETPNSNPPRQVVDLFPHSSSIHALDEIHATRDKILLCSHDSDANKRWENFFYNILCEHLLDDESFDTPPPAEGNRWGWFTSFFHDGAVNKTRTEITIALSLDVCVEPETMTDGVVVAEDTHYLLNPVFFSTKNMTLWFYLGDVRAELAFIPDLQHW